MLPTDTQKNTAFAFAKEKGVASPEEYALALADRLLEASGAATGSRVEVEEYAWDRISVGGSATTTPSSGAGATPRTTVVTLDDSREQRRAGWSRACRTSSS